eukprot:TRINITY_DN553_c0_g1_i1.p1 TRINITY_DN553_c0_g1~~TRINITY_DN553_c0_g1_i1.p1  ORF type:complete len:344 (-),score=24.23 TRINITY_DN553_c0_g1_i1:291-1322(-)
MSVAIIGAGISGLAAARSLTQSGIPVTVFEKSRGAGGRAATRRVEIDGSQYKFDHGAQYFTVRSQQLLAEVEKMKLAGLCAEWTADIRVIDGEVLHSRKDSASPTRYVGVPGMSSIGRYLSEPLSGHIVFNTRIERAEQQSGRWQLKVDDGQIWSSTFTHLLVTAPAEQASAIVPTASQYLLNQVKQRSLAPCWAVMIGFSKRQDIEFDAAFVNNHPSISWISRDSSKPGRSSGSECWVVHASKDFSKQFLEEKPESIAETILHSFLALPISSHRLDRPSTCVAHRWRYSIPESEADDVSFWDPAMKLGYAGDWTSGSRVEGAFLSGIAMADNIRQDLGLSRM